MATFEPMDREPTIEDVMNFIRHSNTQEFRQGVQRTQGDKFILRVSERGFDLVTQELKRVIAEGSNELGINQLEIVHDPTLTKDFDLVREIHIKLGGN